MKHCWSCKPQHNDRFLFRKLLTRIVYRTWNYNCVKIILGGEPSYGRPPVVDHDRQVLIVEPPKLGTCRGRTVRTLQLCKQRRKTRLLPSFQLEQPFCASSGLLSPLLTSLNIHSKRDFAKNKLSWGSRFKNSNQQNFLNTEKQYFYGISSVPHFSILPSSYYV